MTADETVVTLINVSQINPRTVIIQGGAYGEHNVISANIAGTQHNVGAPHFKLRLAPGAGTKITLRMKRHVNQPTFKLPWRL